jgi:hypothetical protein
MSIVKDLVTSASVAAGNVASRERDRESHATYDDGRPRPIGERARGRVQALVSEGAVKLGVSQTAHFGAKEIAKRVGNETAKKFFGVLAKRPTVAAGAALFAFDTARDGFRLARGNIDRYDFAERIGGNVAGLAGSAVGAQVGAFVGSLAMPVVGTVAGSIIGGVVGGIGGDTYGRSKVRNVVGEPYEDYEYDDYADDDYDDDYDDYEEA